MSRPDHDLTDVLRRLGSLPVSRHTVRSVVDSLAEQASDVLGVAPAASVTVLAEGPARTVAASADLALQLDGVQYRDDAGPCLDAARRGGPVGAVSGQGDRWPRFGQALADSGCDSVWSHPLPLDSPVVGSLNLYLPAGVDPDERTTAAAIAEGAAAPVANVWLYEEAVRTTENLRAALESRSVIEQAKGILMERMKLTSGAAFDTLVRISNDTNTKLRDVAEALVRTGTIPPDGTMRRTPGPR